MLFASQVLMKNYRINTKIWKKFCVESYLHINTLRGAESCKSACIILTHQTLSKYYWQISRLILMLFYLGSRHHVIKSVLITHFYHLVYLDICIYLKRGCNILRYVFYLIYTYNNEHRI